MARFFKRLFEMSKRDKNKGQGTQKAPDFERNSCGKGKNIVDLRHEIQKKGMKTWITGY